MDGYSGIAHPETNLIKSCQVNKEEEEVVKRMAWIIFPILNLAFFQIAASAPVGHVLLAPKNGSIYICKTGGKPRKVFTGSAYNAIAWSADAKYIYFMQGNSVWAMKNDGSDAHKLCDGYDTYKNPLATYRPDPNYVLYMEGNKFYKIRYTDGRKTLIHADAQTYKGEIGISADGTRMVGRVDKEGEILSYKITVGGTSHMYHNTCSPSISPDGRYLLYTVSDAHTAFGVVKWDGTHVKNISGGADIIDASKFAVNSNEYIANNHDQDFKVSIFTLSDGSFITVGNLSSEYPDFWVGDQLPDPNGGANIKKFWVKNRAPAKSSGPVFMGWKSYVNVQGTAFSLSGRYAGFHLSAPKETSIR